MKWIDTLLANFSFLLSVSILADPMLSFIFILVPRTSIANITHSFVSLQSSVHMLCHVQSSKQKAEGGRGWAFAFVDPFSPK